eukprot:CAMPEP_0113595026 /NCGR_PEP_ID=MMETSP0015_2-20120614/39418_1 /TAXON_ID=2838 /ORGANISM="Odontella" /LENGTH=285 /DNA_ID=CAMNT_0000502117 /DNA_START=106 /DNA_END=965 /DNA_ORIENTATION=+ /assembly_acc=CAM_ASM_000160
MAAPTAAARDSVRGSRPPSCRTTGPAPATPSLPSKQGIRRSSVRVLDGSYAEPLPGSRPAQSSPPLRALVPSTSSSRETTSTTTPNRFRDPDRRSRRPPFAPLSLRPQAVGRPPRPPPEDALLIHERAPFVLRRAASNAELGPPVRAGDLTRGDHLRVQVGPLAQRSEVRHVVAVGVTHHGSHREELPARTRRALLANAYGFPPRDRRLQRADDALSVDGGDDRTRSAVSTTTETERFGPKREAEGCLRTTASLKNASTPAAKHHNGSKKYGRVILMPSLEMVGE